MTDTLVGVDIGGTFTDLVLFQDGRLRVFKVLSTPDDASRAILEGLRQLEVLDDLQVMVHGSTVATNAVLERKGVPTGLITTAGFRDVLEIGRQARPKLYDLRVQKAPPLVPREWRVEVTERLNERGEVLLALDEQSLHTALATLQEAGVEAIAISLLFSFTNPLHEQTVAEAARSTGAYVSASCEILPEFREYERTSTVVLNSYVGPLIERYLARLEQALPESAVLRIMQSNGGSISSATARREAARSLLSGPAGGAVGAAYVAQAAGFSRIISLDIGGTSTDVALVDGALVETTSGTIGGYPTKLPMIDIHTVGAGGGSLAWFDLGGALRVGPRSAGARPGPAAYGRGGMEATVTDAHVVLGRLIPDAFLLQYPHTGLKKAMHSSHLQAGKEYQKNPPQSSENAPERAITLDVEGAAKAVSAIARRLGTSLEEAASGIIRVVNANMEGAIRVISVERGCDPRDFTLVAFGGAGPLHACELAAALHIPRVLIPPTPGVLSALGMLIADTLKDYVRTVMVPAEEAQDLVTATLTELEQQGFADLVHENIAEDKIVIERYVDLRYFGQSYELTIPFAGDMRKAVTDFHTTHERRFGYADLGERVQVVNVRLKARGLATDLALKPQEESLENKAKPIMARSVTFAGLEQPVSYEVPIYERSALHPGATLAGPAIITQYDTTTVVPPLWQVRVDALDNLIIEQIVAPQDDASPLAEERGDQW